MLACGGWLAELPTYLASRCTKWFFVHGGRLTRFPVETLTLDGRYKTICTLLVDTGVLE